MCNCNKSKTAPPVQKVAPPPVTPLPPSRKAAPSTLAPRAPTPPTPETLPGETLADKCLAFAELLGLEEPVPERVLLAALEHNWYARRLFSNRHEPDFQALLDNPPATTTRKPATGAAFTNARLLAKAGTALARWGFSGFSTVPAEILGTREAACLACPNLAEPSSVLQRMSASAVVSNVTGYRTGNKVCSACGCVVKNKMRLATETCPVEEPAMPGLNRWGEPMQKGG